MRSKTQDDGSSVDMSLTGNGCDLSPSLAAEFLNDYVFLTVGRVGGATTDISQKVVEVGEYEKRDRLSEILQNMGKEGKTDIRSALLFVQTLIFVFSRCAKPTSIFLLLLLLGTDRTLVFVETKRNADFLATYLSQAGFPTTSIHGYASIGTNRRFACCFVYTQIHCCASSIDAPENNCCISGHFY